MDSSDVTVVVMVGVIAVASVWGWKVVPSDARFPVRFGGLGYQTTISKGTALVLWPVIAALVAGGVATAGDESEATLILVGMIALAIMLIAQVASIRKAAR